MAVKVYTPDQFYATGGIVEEMFYEEVGKGTLDPETICQKEGGFCSFL